MGLLDIFFGGGTDQAEVKKVLDKGAVVIDVRTPAEFKGGHVKGSRNFPLQTIGNRIKEIQKMNKPVVLCCATGNRSGQATGLLKDHGVDCINGGGWKKVNNLVS